MSSLACGGHDPSDLSFLLSSGIVIFSMQAGFALLEAGSVKTTSKVNIFMKNVGDTAVGALAFWLIGWPLAYGTASGSNAFLGAGDWAGHGLEDHAGWFFQLSFASTAATIDSGAVAERFKYVPYLALSAYMTAWTYPVAAHWVWSSQGFLYKWGYIDFAGSSVVHLLGAMSGLIGTLWIGARRGRFVAQTRAERERGVSCKIDPSFHASEPLNQLLGTFILFVGWLAFNSGSSLGVTGEGGAVAAHAIVNTVMSAGGGGVVGMAMSLRRLGIVSVDGVCNGMLGGLVAITASAHVVESWEAVLIGGCGAAVCHGTIVLLSRAGIDDPVSAVAVHGATGFFAMFPVGLLAHDTRCGVEPADNGLFYGGGFRLLGVQLAGSLLIAAWSSVCTLAFLAVLQFGLGIDPRVSPEDEDRGLDIAEHGVDRGEELLQLFRGLHLTLGGMEPAEREAMREIIGGFLHLGLAGAYSDTDLAGKIDEGPGLGPAAAVAAGRTRRPSVADLIRQMSATDKSHRGSPARPSRRMSQEPHRNQQAVHGQPPRLSERLSLLFTGGSLVSPAGDGYRDSDSDNGDNGDNAATAPAGMAGSGAAADGGTNSVRSTGAGAGLADSPFGSPVRPPRRKVTVSHAEPGKLHRAGSASSS